MHATPTVNVLVYPAPNDQTDAASSSVMWVGSDRAAHERALVLAADHGSCSVRRRPAEVVLATGDRRPVTKHYSNGYGCPWCDTGVPDGTSCCPNPGCPANAEHWTDAEVHAQVALWRAAEALRAEAKRSAEFSRQYAEEARAEREALWSEATAEATRRGSCPECLRRSGWQFGQPRYVKHRTADFHAS